MKNRADGWITLAVMLSAAALLGGLMFAVVGNPFQRPHLAITADFEDVSGIRVNSQVMYAGAAVGVVRGVSYLEPGERLNPDAVVRLDLAILEKVPIPRNVRVVATSESMLGERHVALIRVDEEGGLLASGERLVAEGGGSMLESLVPGASLILADIEATARSLRVITERLDSGEDGQNLSGMMATLHGTARSLQLAFEGDGEGEPGIKPRVVEMTGDLHSVAGNLRLMIEGDGTEEHPGMSRRTEEIFANLEVFSSELSAFLEGRDGEPGVRMKIGSIMNEVERLLTGTEDEAGLRVQLASVMGKADTLMVEMQTLMIWGQYFTGALAEKPSRLVFSGKTGGVPTKEEILKHLRDSEEPYPVRITASEVSGEEAAAAARLDARRKVLR